MWILGAIRRPVELPVVNVVAFVLILVSTIPVYLAQRISSSVGGRL
jgi:putative spermidine/putrescine transport system permease protein